MGYFMVGLSKGFTSFLIPQLRLEGSEIHATQDEESWLGCLGVITNPIGCLAGGALMELIGRKLYLSIMFVPVAVCWIVVWFASNVNMLHIGFILLGIFGGLVFCTATYITEISTAKHRGIYIAIGESHFAVGVAFGNFLSHILGWRLSSLYLFAISVVCFIAMLTLPESPNWLINKGCADKAAKVLSSIRNSEETMKCEISDLEYHYRELKMRKQKLSDTLKDLFTSWKQFFILIGIFTIQQTVGFNIIIGYSVIYFQSLNIPFDSATASMIYSGVNFFSSFLPPIITSYCSRRKSYLLSGMGVSGSMLVVAAYETLYYSSSTKPYYWTVLLCMCIYNIFLSFGLLAIPYVMASELFPPHIAGIGCGIYGCTGYLIAGTVLKLFPYFLSNFGITITIWTFTFFALISIPYAIFVLPETKGKTLMEIQNTYFGKNNNTNVENF